MKKITLLINFFLLTFTNLNAQTPSNDTCQGAIELAVFDNSCQTPTTGDLTNATDSGIATPSCISFTNEDLWYKIEVPQSGIVTIETSPVNGSTLTDPALAVYTGSCENLNELECDDNDGVDSFAKVELVNLTAGQTLYIRITRYTADTGEFNICAYDPQASASVHQNTTIEGLNLFPNPFTKRLNISAYENINEIHIYNITGQEVLKAHPEAPNYSFITEKLQPGIYLIKIIAGTSATTLKLIKK